MKDGGAFDGRALVRDGAYWFVDREKRQCVIGLLQGGYYLLMGIWPILHRYSFEAVTGRKTDYWLVITVGLLSCAIGWALWVPSRHQQATVESMRLGVATALAFLVIDVTFVLKEIISPVYLADALVEVGIIILWLWTRWGKSSDSRIV